jgi:tetratricopeptide (TPR) repeat protein
MARKISNTASRPRTATALKSPNAAARPAAVSRIRSTREEDIAQNFFLGLALFLLAVLVYYQAFHAGFIWDDDQLLTSNAQVQSTMGWWTLWTSPQTADYFPLTSSTLWLEWHLWGMNPMGYHVMNVLFHATVVVLTWQVLKRLRIPGAWLAAALFAAHPVSVESVAWISERKNTVSQIFFLLSIIQYVRYQEKGSAWRYAAAVFCFFLSLTAKTAVVMLPFILLILSWWRKPQLEPLRESYALSKNPLERWVLLAGIPGALAIMGGGAAYFGWDLVVAQPKLVTAAAVLGPILAAFLAAVVCGAFGAALARKLDNSIERSPVEDWVLIGGVLAIAAMGCWMGAFVGSHIGTGTERLAALAGFALVLGAGLGVMALAGLQRLDKLRLDTFAGLEIVRSLPFFFLAFLLGVVTVYFQNWRAIGGEEIPIGNLWQRMASACFASGFYLYSALWPFNIIEIYPQWHRAFSTLVTLPTPHVAPPAPESIPYWKQAIPGVVIMGTLIWCWMRRSEVWARAILVALGCYFVAMLPALGLAKMSYMRLTLVADHYQYISMVAVIALIVAAGYTRMVKPAWLIAASAIFAFVAYLNWDQTQDNHLYELVWVIGPLTLAFIPKDGESWKWVWTTFLSVLLLCAGIVSFWQADIYESEETLWSATLAKNPYTWQAHNHLGAALYMRGDIKDAFPHFKRATELKPENPESHNNLGLAYAYFGNMDMAIKEYKTAVYIKDDTSMATNLANAYEQVKDYRDAIDTYHHALTLSPANASAHCNLGYALMQMGQIPTAIGEFIKAIELDPVNMPQSRIDLDQALKAEGIDYQAPQLSGTYPFDAPSAVQLLKQFPPPPPQPPGQQGGM